MSNITLPQQVLEERVKYLNGEVGRLEASFKEKENEISQILGALDLKKRGIESGISLLESQRSDEQRHFDSLKESATEQSMILNAAKHDLLVAEERKRTIERDCDEMKTALALREGLLGDREESLMKTERYLEMANKKQVEREQGSEARQKALNAREVSLDAKEVYLESRLRDTEVARQDVEKRQSNLDSGQENLDQRESQIKNDQEANRREGADLAGLREGILEDRRDFEKRMSLIRTKEAELQERERLLLIKERELRVQEQEYKIRLDEVVLKERILKNKEKALNIVD